MNLENAVGTTEAQRHREKNNELLVSQGTTEYSVTPAQAWGPGC